MVNGVNETFSAQTDVFAIVAGATSDIVGNTILLERRGALPGTNLT
jgi:hypothetical protein